MDVCRSRLAYKFIGFTTSLRKSFLSSVDLVRENRLSRRLRSLRASIASDDNHCESNLPTLLVRIIELVGIHVVRFVSECTELDRTVKLASTPVR